MTTYTPPLTRILSNSLRIGLLLTLFVLVVSPASAQGHCDLSYCSSQATCNNTCWYEYFVWCPWGSYCYPGYWDSELATCRAVRSDCCGNNCGNDIQGEWRELESRCEYSPNGWNYPLYRKVQVEGRWMTKSNPYNCTDCDSQAYCDTRTTELTGDIWGYDYCCSLWPECGEVASCKP